MTNIEVPGVFEAAWCARMRARLGAAGFEGASPEYPATYRTNGRWVRDDPALAAELFARARPHLPPTMVDAAGVTWTLSGLNPRMRACRYGAGEWFGVHRDGVCWVSPRERSFWSVLVYLDDDFEGGHTRVFEDRRGARTRARIVPAPGKLAVIDHAWWHDGAPVTAGTKHVLRTDAMYTAAVDAPEGHRGYVWSLAALDDGELASGGRDRTIRLWRGAACVGVVPDAHAASVTCLAAHGGGLVSGSRDRSVAWWVRAGSGLTCVRRVEAHAGAVLAVASSPRGALSAGADGAVITHGLGGPGGEGTRLVAHDGWAWGVADVGLGRVASVGADGRLVVSAGSAVLGAFAVAADLRAVCPLDAAHVAVGTSTGEVVVVRIEDGAVTARWAAHDGAITSLAALGGGRLASGGEDDRACAWSSGGAIACTEVRAHGDFVRAVCRVGDDWVSAGFDGLGRWNRPPNAGARSP